ncbi:hypothetical protein T01_7281 [Trichinella spiralis]|uniref:Uncharacterized protein n=1 Tax=Trichinella spiralis TaxID=6334 RepID=A0A0V1BX18_TRISP|nr:hypothetical protein T01_7281 [Trichinella spiralis]
MPFQWLQQRKLKMCYTSFICGSQTRYVCVSTSLYVSCVSTIGAIYENEIKKFKITFIIFFVVMSNIANLYWMIKMNSKVEYFINL